MAKRKGGFGILPIITVFLGLLAVGGGLGTATFYNKFDAVMKEDKPKLEAERDASKKREEKAIARWKELAPWVLDTKFQSPEDFDASDGKKEIDTQVAKPTILHLKKDDWPADFEGQKTWALTRAKVKIEDVIKVQDEVINTRTAERDNYKKAVEELNKQLAAALDDKKAQEKASQERLSSLQAELSVATQKAADTESRLKNREDELNQKVTAAQREQKRVADLKDKEISDLQNDNTKLVQDKERLQQRKETKTVVPEPSGEVIGIAQPLGVAYINLGRKQHVERGMQFGVFSQGKGGALTQKGKIEIRNVEEDRSKVGILSQRSERDPIVVGDLIWNPIYKRDARPVFVLCGEMEHYSSEDTERLIVQNGGQVRAESAPGVDFVVAAGDVSKYQGKSLENYNEAKKLGLRIMSERDLLEYLPSFGGK